MTEQASPMRVAVVVPVYNHSLYLGPALESVLAQTRRPERILVLDDGSKDDSLEVARGFEGDGVEAYTQENAGAHNALNRLIERASSDCEVIAILNSDDLFEPERLSRCLDALDADPKAEVVSTPLQLIDGEGDRLSETHPRALWFAAAWGLGTEEGLSLPSWLGLANFPATTSNVVARSAYLRANPLRDYRYCHDYFLLASAAVEGGLRVLDGDPLLRYRVHEANTITTTPESLVREMLRMRLDLARHLAPRVSTDPGAQARFADLLQGFWGNLSSIPEAEAQLVLAGLLGEFDESVLAEAVESVPAERLASFPNKAMVNADPEGHHPLGRGPELARRVERLQTEKTKNREKTEALHELATLRHLLGRSRWVALGRVLGTGRRLAKNDGKTPSQKLQALRTTLDRSPWIRLGIRLGSKTCAELKKLG